MSLVGLNVKFSNQLWCFSGSAHSQAFLAFQDHCMRPGGVVWWVYVQAIWYISAPLHTGLRKQVAIEKRNDKRSWTPKTSQWLDEMDSANRIISNYYYFRSVGVFLLTSFTCLGSKSIQCLPAICIRPLPRLTECRRLVPSPNIIVGPARRSCLVLSGWTCMVVRPR